MATLLTTRTTLLRSARLMPLTPGMLSPVLLTPARFGVRGLKTLDPAANVDEKFITKRGWEHPVYSKEEMEAITYSHRPTKGASDFIAYNAVRLLRKGFDFFSGYIHPEDGKPYDLKHRMTPEKWLTRVIFLESIAGVPGMVAGMVRHLHSLRLLRRDKAWIQSLLEEAYNERMHLLVFMTMAQPGFFMRALLLGAQGVFFNMFFLSYLVSPKTCHRFVGYLEEEAVFTYTRLIEDMDKGILPEWVDMQVPQIARQYFNMKPEDRMRDMILNIRADEAKHREVNHTFGNLKPTDPNPFVLDVKADKPQPREDLKNHHPEGWKREELIL